MFLFSSHASCSAKQMEMANKGARERASAKSVTGSGISIPSWAKKPFSWCARERFTLILWGLGDLWGQLFRS